MSNLKDQLIKLGSTNPELQKHIRPVLDVLASRSMKARYESTVQYINRSSIIQKVVGKFIRVRWVRGAVLLEELPIKGKRRLSTMYVEYEYLSRETNAFLSENLLRSANIQKGDTFKAAEKKIHKALEAAAQRVEGMDVAGAMRNVGITKEDVYYLNVAPASSEPITAEGRDFTITSKWLDFSVASPSSDMQNHDPHYTVYKAKSPSAARKLYKILNADPDALSSVAYKDLGDWFDRNKISYKVEFSQW